MSILVLERQGWRGEMDWLITTGNPFSWKASLPNPSFSNHTVLPSWSWSAPPFLRAVLLAFALPSHLYTAALASLSVFTWKISSGNSLLTTQISLCLPHVSLVLLPSLCLSPYEITMFLIIYLHVYFLF